VELLAIMAVSHPWSMQSTHRGLRFPTHPGHLPLGEGRFGTHLRSNFIVKIKATLPFGDWSSWLPEGVEAQALEVLGRNVENGLPCATENFIPRLEKLESTEFS
jgi:hypothetical protein